MNTLKPRWLTRVLAVASLAISLCAHAGPEFDPNMVVETSAPGLARLEVLLNSNEWKEPRRFVFEGRDSIVGGISVPKESPAEYSMTAFDGEGKVINTGKGSIPSYGVLDKPMHIPLPPAGEGEGLIVALNRERIALEVLSSPETPNERTVRAHIFDPQGNPANFDPGQIYWQLSNGRILDLRRARDPGDWEVVPPKGIEFAELCPLTPVVTACRESTQCKAIEICTDPWEKISVGTNHACALTKTGAAFCWGLNQDGQLGAPTTTSCVNNSSSGAKCSSRPLPVVCPAGTPCRFRQIAAGTTLTAAVDINGDVWWWGRGLPDHHKVEATLASAPVEFSLVAAGFGHGCAISMSSDVWCWGTNAFEESGLANGHAQHGTNEVPHWAPVRVMVPFKARKIAAGGEHTCAIGKTGVDVVCWGRDDDDQTSGPNSTISSATGTAKFHFQHFNGLIDFQDVITSVSSTCVMFVAGGATCWGAHASKNMGVAAFGALELLTAGTRHVCALVNQQAKCFGTNNLGELGIGSMMWQSAPANVKAPPTAFATLSAGDSFTCGITPDGDAYCWGFNQFGQVGNGSTSFSVNAPSKVATP